MEGWRIWGVVVIALSNVQASFAEPVVQKTPVVEVAEEPETLRPVIETVEAPLTVDPILEGQQVQQFLNRSSVIIGEGFAPLREGEAAQPVRVARAEPAWPIPTPWQSPQLTPQVQLLRDAAWALEQSAHQLEAGELYDRADELRELAKQLRLDARELRASTAE